MPGELKSPPLGTLKWGVLQLYSGVQPVVDRHVEVIPERVLHLHHVRERRVVYDVPLVKHQGVKLRRARCLNSVSRY